jgi:AhpD family alkylhydroperoxidase
MVPNLLGTLAESPQTLKGYLALAGLFEETSLSPEERQVVLLAVSFENACEYCMAAHSMGARRQGVAAHVIDALRNGAALPDARLEALRVFAQAVVRQRGWAEREAESFVEAGFTKAQLLDVVLGVAQKTLSNYVNHLAHTPLDAALEPEKWHKSAA